jgi:hypothetical protein
MEDTILGDVRSMGKRAKPLLELIRTTVGLNI